MQGLLARTPGMVADFPIDAVPPPGVGAMTLHSSPSGRTVLKKVLDVRDPASFRFTDDEAAALLTGLLSDKGTASLPGRFSAEDVLRGTYLVEFPCTHPLVGEFSVAVSQKAAAGASPALCRPSPCPDGCGVLKGCRHCSSDTSASHSTRIAVTVGPPRSPGEAQPFRQICQSR